MHRRSDATLTRGQLEAVLRSLRRGVPRPEALRQAGVDPVSFAAEYWHSPAIREAIIRAEGGTPSGDAWTGARTLAAPRPYARPAPQEDGSEQEASDTSPVFSGALWLVVLVPLLLAVAFLAAGAAPDVPPLGW